jgi:hypothetical protein
MTPRRARREPRLATSTWLVQETAALAISAVCPRYCCLLFVLAETTNSLTPVVQIKKAKRNTQEKLMKKHRT